ncbi:MAG TPA: hypothetical protein VFH58_07375 [Acidimicrobiales bacterium]|nr:hypothetical protein [Acidimicrobiales bacterium]
MIQTTLPLIAALAPTDPVSSTGNHRTHPCVPMPLDVLDGVIDDLYAVGLILARGDRPEGRVDNPDVLIDRAVTRIRQAVLDATTGPDRSGAVLAAMVASRKEQPLTIELLDAAHAANRAVIDLRVASE